MLIRPNIKTMNIVSYGSQPFHAASASAAISAATLAASLIPPPVAGGTTFHYPSTLAPSCSNLLSLMNEKKYMGMRGKGKLGPLLSLLHKDFCSLITLREETRMSVK